MTRDSCATIRRRRAVKGSYGAFAALGENRSNAGDSAALLGKAEQQPGVLVPAMPYKVLLERLVCKASSLWFYLLGPARALQNLFVKASTGWSLPSIERPSAFTFNEDITAAMEQLKRFTAAENAYDSANAVHEHALLEYWSICCPGVKLEARFTKQWKRIGFQGTDPASDIRGAGILGLENLLHFARKYPAKFSSMIQHCHYKEGQECYPFSIAGLNVTMLVMQCLGWGFKPLAVTPLSHRNLVHILFSCAMGNLDKDIEKTTFWDEPSPLPDLISFDTIDSQETKPSSISFGEALRGSQSVGIAAKSLLCDSGISEATEHALHEVFCMCFIELEEEWYSRETVSYMDFPAVLAATAGRVQILLERFNDVDQVEESNSTFERAALAFSAV